MSVSASTLGTRARRESVSNSIRARCVSYLYTRVMESRVLYGNFSVTSINRSFVRPRRPSLVALAQSAPRDNHHVRGVDRAARRASRVTRARIRPVSRVRVDRGRRRARATRNRRRH